MKLDLLWKPRIVRVSRWSDLTLMIISVRWDSSLSDQLCTVMDAQVLIFQWSEFDVWPWERWKLKHNFQQPIDRIEVFCSNKRLRPLSMLSVHVKKKNHFKKEVHFRFKKKPGVLVIPDAYELTSCKKSWTIVNEMQVLHEKEKIKRKRDNQSSQRFSVKLN